MKCEKEVLRQIDNILLFGAPLSFSAHLVELGVRWLTRGWVAAPVASALHCPTPQRPTSPPGHGRGGCVPWQNQPGDGGEAPARHGSGWQLFAERQRERPRRVLPVCAVSMSRWPRAPGPPRALAGGAGGGTRRPGLQHYSCEGPKAFLRSSLGSWRTRLRVRPLMGVSLPGPSLSKRASPGLFVAAAENTSWGGETQPTIYLCSEKDPGSPLPILTSS